MLCPYVLRGHHVDSCPRAGPSSNGRSPDFGSGNGGSNPPGPIPPSRARPMTPHPTVRALFTVVSCCLLTESLMAQGLPRARPEDVGLSATALERIATTLQSYVDSGKFPGFLALVARHGKLAYLTSVGWMDVEHRRAMSSDAVFRIYSLTKPIASTAVMQLYERGKLRLDDPVSKYIPAFTAVRGLAPGHG